LIPKKPLITGKTSPYTNKGQQGRENAKDGAPKKKEKNLGVDERGTEKSFYSRTPNWRRAADKGAQHRGIEEMGEKGRKSRGKNDKEEKKIQRVPTKLTLTKGKGQAPKKEETNPCILELEGKKGRPEEKE